MWLLRPGPRAELARRARAFAGTQLARVLAAPEGEAAEWAAAVARAAGAPHAHADELRERDEPAAAAAERAWPAIEGLLADGWPRALAVLPGGLLQAIVARVLGLPPANAGALRVDPGRAVLLRDEPIGLVLRRSNVLAPAPEDGSALPSGTPEGAR